MKKAFLPLAVGLFLILTPSFVAAMPFATDVTYLSNKDVLAMVQSKVPEEAIIRAIKSSPCTFDTFPPVLKEMKRKGVPDGVLQAMVEAPYGPSTEAKFTDDVAADQPIYHFADQLRQMGYITPSTVRTSNRYARQSSRARTSTRRRQ